MNTMVHTSLAAYIIAVISAPLGQTNAIQEV
jgi:hypothetical protein